MTIIFHIPHDSLRVPRYFYKGLKISKEMFRKYNIIMSDYKVTDFVKHHKGIIFKPKYSRLFCDVERYKDPKKEIMEKYGQGVIYTKTYDGTIFHEHDEKYKQRVMKYYDRYHKKLNKLIERKLKHDDVILFDVHSFSDEAASYLKKPPFPDICIGYDDIYTGVEFLKEIVKKIDKKYSFKINYPYEGTMVPTYFFTPRLHKHKFNSIMIEINKRIYLEAY